jgi:hypothetical protein
VARCANKEALQMGDMAAACREAASHLQEVQSRIASELHDGAGDGGAELALEIVGKWENEYAPQLQSIVQYLTQSADEFQLKPL